MNMDLGKNGITLCQAIGCTDDGSSSSCFYGDFESRHSCQYLRHIMTQNDQLFDPAFIPNRATG